MPSLIQRPTDPKPSAGAVAAFVKSHLLLSERKVIKYGKPSAARGYLRSVRTVVYQFWAHLIWTPRLGKRGKKFFVKVNRCFMQIYIILDSF